MKGTTTTSQTEPSPGAIADTVAPGGDQPVRHATLDPVEKMLLGVAPDDLLAVTIHPTDLMRDPRAARLEVVRKFLAHVPELRAELAKDINEAWNRADGQRGEFVKAFAERRAQVLSLAEVGQFRQQAPQAIADFNTELSRYLMEMEGFKSLMRREGPRAAGQSSEAPCPDTSRS
jgi:hypothetical protein